MLAAELLAMTSSTRTSHSKERLFLGLSSIGGGRSREVSGHSSEAHAGIRRGSTSWGLGCRLLGSRSRSRSSLGSIPRKDDALRRVELGSELRQSGVSLSIGLEESFVAVTELLSKGLEARIFEESSVRGELEELGVSVGVWDGGEVAVVESQPLLGPGRSSSFARSSLAIRTDNLASISVLGDFLAEPRAVLVRTSDGVGARESNDLLVSKTHPVEHLAQMSSSSGILSRGSSTLASELSRWTSLSVREVSLRGAVARASGVNTSIPHRDLGPASKFDGDGRSHLEQVGIGDSWELLLDRLQHLDGVGQTSVGAMVDLGIEADGAGGAASLGESLDAVVVGTRVMPGETNHDWVCIGLIDELLQRRLRSHKLLRLLFHRRHGHATDDSASPSTNTSSLHSHGAGEPSLAESWSSAREEQGGGRDLERHGGADHRKRKR
mmetsp:Transcript_14618/g.49913  ORF Transcript_14618/g.49913 Transcript_14618/m.49913 type:complete len:439 (+) Transcript_14618:539-1855(+)